MQLYEKYRPTKFSEVVGQPQAIKRLSCLAKTTGIQGQVFWIVGESGTGKTTLARIIASYSASEFTTYEIDAQDLSLETIREWERKCQLKPLSYDGKPGGYSFVINESHGLSNKAVSRLQTVLEDRNVQKNSTWVFTTTNQGQDRLFGDKFDACPFLSRAVCIDLAMDNGVLLEMAKRLSEIATIEDVNGKPLDAYCDLISRCKGNMRQALQLIAAGEMLD